MTKRKKTNLSHRKQRTLAHAHIAPIRKVRGSTTSLVPAATATTSKLETAISPEVIDDIQSTPASKMVDASSSADHIVRDTTTAASASREDSSNSVVPQPPMSLKQFFRVHGPLVDHDKALFVGVHLFTQVRTVLYPDCGQHVVPSLVFPNVTYVDTNPDLASFYNSPKMKQWLRNKQCKPQAGRDIMYLCKDCSTEGLGIPKHSIGLMISKSGGAGMDSCLRYIKKNGYVLIGNDRAQASSRVVNAELRLVGAFDTNKLILITHSEGLSEFNIQGNIQKCTTEETGQEGRSSKNVEKEAMWYLFQKKV